MIRPSNNRMVVRPGANRRRPGEPLIVRYPPPDTRRTLPAEGASVPMTLYWLRRLRSGDVVPVESASSDQED